MCAVDASIVHSHDINTAYITGTASLVLNLGFLEGWILFRTTALHLLITTVQTHSWSPEDMMLCDIFWLLQI